MSNQRNRGCVFQTGLFLLGVMICPCLEAYTTGDSDSLLTSLLVTAGYNVNTRPSDPVTVTVNLRMTDIQDVNVKAGTFSITGWWIISWTDSRLVWTPGLEGGITAIILYENSLWSPVLVVSNSNGGMSAIDDDTIPLRVTSAGLVTWQPPATVTVSCSLDITFYPFDKQTCYVELTSFGYNLNELDLTSSAGIILDYYSPNGEWTLDSVSVRRSEYEDTGSDYARLTYEVNITRKADYYGLNVIFPVVVCGCMIIFVFLVPAESGEKLGYSLTILLTFVVLMTLVATNMPTTAQHTSFLEVYIGLILALSAIAVILAICIVKMHHVDNDKKPVPEWVKKVTRVCRKLCCKGDNPGKVGTSERDGQAAGMEDGFQNKANRKKLDNQGTQVEELPPIKLNTINPRPNSPQSESNISGNDETISWQDVAAILDSVMSRLFTILIFGFTFVFLVVLGTAPQ